MPSPFDPSEFEDHEFTSAQRAGYPPPTAPASGAKTERPPTREEVDHKVGEMQQRLAELQRAQEQLERERAGLEETRRRQAEFENSRAEMLEQLTRGIGLLEDAELDKRREVDQMAAALRDLRESLSRVQSLREESWTSENFPVELTRALTTLENARMEWNSARTKFDVLSRDPNASAELPVSGRPGPLSLADTDWPTLCRLGLAVTWPLVLTGLAIAVAVVMMSRNS